MKKFITTLFFSILFLSFSILTVSADASITISDDYQTITMDGKSYLRYNTSKIDSAYEYIDKIDLTRAQRKIIKDTELYQNDDQTVLEAELQFADGASMTIHYLREDYVIAYQEYESQSMTQYSIDFRYTKTEDLIVEKKQLFDKPVQLEDFSDDWYYYYQVYGISKNESVRIPSGIVLLTYEDHYYYIDYQDNHFDDDYTFFYPDNYDQLSAYEITDPKLQSTFLNVEENNSPFASDDMELFEDEEEKYEFVLGMIYIVLCVVLFVILPLILIITFLILDKKAGTSYKKIYRWIIIPAILELGPAIYILINAFT